MIRREDVCVFALGKIFCYEPRLAKALVDGLGSASDVFSMTEDQLFELFGPFSKYREVIGAVNLDAEAETLEKILSDGCRYMTYDNAAFPGLLKQCEDAPIGLFVKGSDTLENIFGREMVAFVGTRDASSYGRDWCSRMVMSLAESDVRPTIVSGLAYGIDISAHIAALEQGLPTIAVLGTGISKIYPHCHTRYARQIMERPSSAIVSEYPPGVMVSATSFLARNRIIAGMSRATVLVESRIKGGGMTTAREAASYNRDVFALPGRNDDIRSQGCNMLIHSRLADAVISCDELFKSLGYKKKAKKTGEMILSCREFYAGSMDVDKIDKVVRIISVVRSNRGITSAELSQELGIPFSEVLPLVGRLEADGFIETDMLQRCSIAKNS